MLIRECEKKVVIVLILPALLFTSPNISDATKWVFFPQPPLSQPFLYIIPFFFITLPDQPIYSPQEARKKKRMREPDIYHHHHVVPPARISLTLSRHFSLSFIAFGRSSRLHLVSSHSCSMYVRAGRPAFVWPYAGVHRSTSLMSSSLLFQQCPACLVRLTCIVFVMGGRWPYSWRLVGCCRQDLFNIALNIFV